MVKQFTKDLFASTYKDDYRDSDNYYRILFNNGRALQARELTQMQTIIQEEIGRLGQNLFKEGSSINPGGVTINNNYEFIKLDTVANPLPTDLSTVVGVEFTAASNSIKVQVLEVVDSENGDPATLYVKYTDTQGATASNNTIRVTAGDTLSSGGVTLKVQSTNTIANPAVGVGTRVSINSGDFFARKHLVFSPKQSKIISKYTSNPDSNIGFKVIEDVVTASDNDALYDNSGANPNVSAPGADRYRIRLIIATSDEVNSDENFIEVAQIRNGLIVAQVKSQDSYNEINNLLATRTFEESGNYIAKNFILSIQDIDSDDNSLEFNISPGVAYINGYRAAVEYNKKLLVNKPRTTTTVNNDVIAANYGSYVLTNKNIGLFDIASFEQVNLRSAADYGGSTIGTARVRAIEEDGANYRLYLFDIRMNTGFSFRQTKSIGTSATNYANNVLVASQAVLLETLASQNNMLFELSGQRPSSLSDISLQVQRYFTATTDGSGEASISLSRTGETFADTNLWVAAAADSDAFAPSVTGSGTQSATLSGAPVSTTIQIAAYVNKSIGTSRTKLLKETTEVITPDSADNVVLSNPDIYSIVSIKDTDSDGQDIASRYSVDNGQRDNYYDLGSLSLLSNSTAPTGDVFVRYKYFDHGASGDFFSVNSYAGQVDYEDIPAHTLANGQTVQLRDVLDFRSAVNSSRNFGSGATIHEVPRQTDLITADISYYNRKSINIVISETGELKAIESKEGISTSIPSTPDKTLSLFEVNLNPYVLNTSDLSSRYIEAKRYTMEDIGKIEKRISRVEEATSLSLLELETSALEVLDSAGLSRTKSGFFADNFIDGSRSAAGTDGDYAAAIDPQAKNCSVPEATYQVDFKYDNTLSSNVIKKGDNVYLTYDHEKYIDQFYATGTENVNPFAVVQKLGIMKLSPSSDTWFDTEYVPDNIIDGGAQVTISNLPPRIWWRRWGLGWWSWWWTGFSRGSTTTINLNTTSTAALLTELNSRFNQNRVTNRFSLLRGSWWWGWQGFRESDIADLRNASAGDVIGSNSRTFGLFSANRTLGGTNSLRVTDAQTVNEQIGDRVISRTSIPFMRNRKVYFKAEGMKPNSRYFAFFDGVNVTSFCRSETFQRWSDDPAIYGSDYTNITEHPDGSSQLYSDTNGIVQGSFWIPATKNIKIKGGQKEFTLIDISVLNFDDSTSSATAPYVSDGTLVTRQRDIRSTRHITARIERNAPVQVNNIDPLAQSFLVKEAGGIYLTKVDLRFATKSSDTPVFVQIRETVNGVPTGQPIPDAQVSLGPSSINTSTDATAVTTFEFEEPIYLSGNKEYAVVILSNSNDYEVYTAKAGDLLLGSTERRLKRQATLGSLFKSQNGSTWTPDQTQDLTFTLHKAKFNVTSGTVILENVDLPSRLMTNDPIYTQNGSGTIEFDAPDHNLLVGDTVVISGAPDINGITASNINGTRTVTAIDTAGFQIVAGNSDTATSDGTGGGETVAYSAQYMFDAIGFNIQVLEPDQTSISYQAKFTSGKSHAGLETPYVKDTSYVNIVNNRPQLFTSPKMIAAPANEVSNLGSGVRSLTLKIDIETTNEDVSPIIDLQRVAATLVHNQIDNPSSTSTAGFNQVFGYVPETAPSQTSGLAKHITAPATLQDTAKGIKILIGANRPPEASIDVYYRTNGGSVTDLSLQNWTLASSVANVPADNDREVFREYEYLVGGVGGTLDEFDQMQIKVVFRSTNSSKVPTLRDIRAIAMAV